MMLVLTLWQELTGTQAKHLSPLGVESAIKSQLPYGDLAGFWRRFAIGLPLAALP